MTAIDTLPRSSYPGKSLGGAESAPQPGTEANQQGTHSVGLLGVPGPQAVQGFNKDPFAVEDTVSWALTLEFVKGCVYSSHIWDIHDAI